MENKKCSKPPTSYVLPTKRRTHRLFRKDDATQRLPATRNKVAVRPPQTTPGDRERPHGGQAEFWTLR